MVWAMVVLWDDGDPSDHASVSDLEVFGTLEAARAASLAWIDELGARPTYEPELDELDAAPDGSDMDAAFERWRARCRETPELYDWSTGREPWDGGYLMSLRGRPVQ